MACRIGITTNPERRKREWKMRHQNLRNWKIIANGLSYSLAQQKEKKYAQRDGCIANPGGPNNGKRNWSVYYFNY